MILRRWMPTAVGAAFLILLVMALRPRDGEPRPIIRAVMLEHCVGRCVAATLRCHLGPDSPVRVTADDRTNKLLLSGPTPNVETAIRLVEELDIPVYISGNFVQAFVIKNRDCNEVVALLERLVDGSGVFGRPRGQPRPSPPPCHDGACWLDEEKPGIACDSSSHHVFVVGTKLQQEVLARVIDLVDSAP